MTNIHRHKRSFTEIDLARRDDWVAGVDTPFHGAEVIVTEKLNGVACFVQVVLGADSEPEVRFWAEASVVEKWLESYKRCFIGMAQSAQQSASYEVIPEESISSPFTCRFYAEFVGVGEFNYSLDDPCLFVFGLSIDGASIEFEAYAFVEELVMQVDRVARMDGVALSVVPVMFWGLWDDAQVDRFAKEFSVVGGGYLEGAVIRAAHPFMNKAFAEDSQEGFVWTNPNPHTGYRREPDATFSALRVAQSVD